MNGIPGREAMRVLGGIVVPGLLLAYALLQLVDAALDSNLLVMLTSPSGVAAVAAGGTLVLLLGVLWNGLLNHLEKSLLDPRTSRTQLDDVGEEHEAEDRTLHNRVWYYYRAHIRRYENRHLSALVTLFHWEWVTGWALLVASTSTMLHVPTVPALGLGDCHLRWLALIGILLSGLLVWGARSTHVALSDIRRRMVEADETSPLFAPPKSTSPSPPPSAPLGGPPLP